MFDKIIAAAGYMAFAGLCLFALVFMGSIIVVIYKTSALLAGTIVAMLLLAGIIGYRNG